MFLWSLSKSLKKCAFSVNGVVVGYRFNYVKTVELFLSEIMELQTQCVTPAPYQTSSYFPSAL